jgi:hypothetical protein
MHPPHSPRRGIVAKPALLLLGLLGSAAGAVVASINLHERIETLRQERTQLIQQQAKLAAARFASDEQVRAIALDERQQENDLSGMELGRRRLIERAWRRFEAQPDALPTAPGLLIQSKAGKIYFPELLAEPKYSQAAFTVERLQIETDYGRLFALLELAPGEQERLIQLLTEREMAKQDILGLTSDANDHDAMTHRVQAAREWSRRVKEELGSACLQAIEEFDGQVRLRAMIADLDTRFSHTETPLAPLQAEQLLRALIAALGPKIGTRYWSIPDRVIEQMRPNFSSAQIAKLEQIQEEQLAVIEARDVRPSDRTTAGQ